ncbi:hypothetical protein JRQ81_002560 [Phrynocephalus forsythii]|uniref:Uncharacterized protein n=1 Tax=Phrynocephalus forsythii TaxID=171643 RepID=A0A9Q0XI66_9SAUR|nr:hypothetical protein JRQ81_002560 [Phrynocephalus forsythii]
MCYCLHLELTLCQVVFGSERGRETLDVKDGFSSVGFGAVPERAFCSNWTPCCAFPLTCRGEAERRRCYILLGTQHKRKKPLNWCGRAASAFKELQNQLERTKEWILLNPVYLFFNDKLNARASLDVTGASL